MPITIDFQANAAAFDAAVKQVDRGLEKQQQQLDKLRASSVSMSDAQAKAMQKVEGELKQQAKELENLQKSEQKSAAHKARAAARAEQLTKQQMASRRELQRLLGEVHRDEVRGAREAQRAERDKARAIRRENEQMGREARKVWEQTATPLERYNAKVDRLKQLLDAGHLSQQRYTQAVGEAKRELNAAGRASKGFFGSQSLSMIKSHLGAVTSVGGAIAAIVASMRTANQIAEQAATKAQQSRMGVGSLAQLAEGDPGRMKQLLGFTDQVMKAGGAETRDEAARLVFAAVSAGQEKQIGTVAGLRAAGVMEDPASQFRATSALQAAMGTRETGDFRALGSKALAASQIAPSSMSQLLEGAARAGGGAAALGLTDEELLAATAVASKVTGTASEAGTQIRSLLRSLARSTAEGTLGGGTLAEMVGGIEAKGMTAAGLQEFLGSDEAVAGYRALRQNRGEFTATTQAIREAEATDLLGRTMKLGGIDPSQRAAVELTKARGSLDVSRRKTGDAENLTDAFQSRMETLMRKAGYSELYLAARQAGQATLDWIPGVEGEQLSRAPIVYSRVRDRSGIRDPEIERMFRENQAAFGLDPAEAKALGIELKGAAAELRAAARDLRGGPTLVPAGEDR